MRHLKLKRLVAMPYECYVHHTWEHLAAQLMLWSQELVSRRDGSHLRESIVRHSCSYTQAYLCALGPRRHPQPCTLGLDPYAMAMSMLTTYARRSPFPH